MRKIISIVIALGLILALSAVAVPAGAQTTPCATVAPASSCAGATVTFTITGATAPATMLEGVDRLSVNFTAGTTFGTFAAGDIKVNGVNVDVTKVVKTGTHLDFPIPAGAGVAGVIAAGTAIGPIVIAKVINPTADGTKTLSLDYKPACCPEQDFCFATYKVLPACSTYEIVVDFDDTYPGIAEDFVPPFKACGQNDTGKDYDTVLDPATGKWYDQFDLIFRTKVLGCSGCCANATLTMALTKAVAGSNATISVNGTWYDLVVGKVISLPNIPVSASMNVTWPSLLHFDKVSAPGVYTICFNMTCPAGVIECPLCSSAPKVLAQRCYDFKVYQWKDATKLIIDEKWNLISLPLVPLTDPKVSDVLAAMDPADRANVDSVWYYDRPGCTAAGTWKQWPTDPNMTMEDGKAYWMRLKYPLPNCGNITLWVWGTEKPVPPSSPAQYPVCAGWNMVGFTSLNTTMNPYQYLWNWVNIMNPVFPVVYGWDHGCWTSQGWELINFGTGFLEPGQGYWIAFPSAGNVYVP